MTYLLLVFLGTITFLISTLSGGGGGLLLVPAISFLFGANSAAPIINLASFIGRPVRLLLFWSSIHWEICLYYIPGALIGAILGGWIFSFVQLDFLRIIIGLFLISTVFQFSFGKRRHFFSMLPWYFTPIGFIVAILSTIIGGIGPVLNPFYLNFGLEKEALIGTKTANSFFVGIVQIGTYSFFNILTPEFWVFGLVLGIGVALGNYFGKRLLKKLSNQLFRQFVIAMMVLSGLLMVIKALLP